MRLVEFLIQLLDAQAQTLQRLEALLGAENLLMILENMPESAEGAPENVLKFNPNWFDATHATGMNTAYAALEGAVREFHLSPTLEFHLWAYPHYRAFIESPLELGSQIQGPGGEAGLALVEEAVAQAQAWVRRLPLPPEMVPQVERATHVPWLRFRAEVLKRIGRRPMGPVY